MRRIVVAVGISMFLSAGCATTQKAKAGAAEDTAAAKSRASGAVGEAEGQAGEMGEEAQAAGAGAMDSAEGAGEGWKDKLLGDTASKINCSKDQVKIDDWNAAMSGSWGASCGDNKYRCSSEGGLSCDPE